MSDRSSDSDVNMSEDGLATDFYSETPCNSIADPESDVNDTSDKSEDGSGSDDISDSDDASDSEDDSHSDTSVKSYIIACDRTPTPLCSRIVISATDFALSLLPHFPSSESMVISPLSIGLSLALAHAGANGETKNEIREVLCNGASDEKFVDFYRDMLKGLLKEENVSISVANRAYILQKYQVKDAFIQNIKQAYKTTAESLNFDDGEGSAKVINRFVSDSTNNMISNITNASFFNDPLLRIVLVNAIYINAPWQSVFSRGLTFEDFFYMDKEVETNRKRFMKSVGNRGYYENEHIQVLSLSYANRDFKFLVVLPKNHSEFEMVRKTLTGEKLQSIIEGMKDWENYSNVSLAIPKFTIKKKCNLKSILKMQGFRKAFENGEADFCAIADHVGDPLYLSDIQHETCIEVSESGTKAYAYTVIRSSGGCSRKPPTPKIFRADHPFLFFITYKRSILFQGQYCG